MSNTGENAVIAWGMTLLTGLLLSLVLAWPACDKQDSLRKCAHHCNADAECIRACRCAP